VTGAPLLRADGLVFSFGGVVAVDHVSLAVPPAELRGIIGPNGAGKSTLFNLIAGHLTPREGTLELAGTRIERLPPDRRARLGVGIAFQAVRLFRGMSVLENVMVGAHATTGHGAIEAFLTLPRNRREERQIRTRAEDALTRIGMQDLAARPAESLPLGQQRSVQVARALCGEPRLLLLDEPASGLRGAERSHLANLLAQLRAQGLTMLVVEHDVAFVSRLADRITVMDAGRVIAEDAPNAVQRDPAVIAAYLGQARADPA
jgi:branched-chain amino acid transport system ATP-binding protein